MSQENVEAVRRGLEAWNRRDLDALLAVSDPEVEFVNSPTAVEPGTRLGHQGLGAVLRAQWEMLTDARAEIERTYDLGQRVIALVRLSRQMPESEARIENQGLVAWTIHDGKVTRIEVLAFGSSQVQDALKAAGLSR